MIKKLKNKNQGVTLLETTLYVAILSTLVFGIASFVNLVSDVRVKNQVMSEVDQQALEILETISIAVRAGVSASLPSQNSLSVVDMNNNTVLFSSNSGVLTIDRGDGVVNLNNSRVVVDSVVFRNLSRPGTSKIIETRLTLSYDSDSSAQIYNYSKTYVASSNLSK